VTPPVPARAILEAGTTRTSAPTRDEIINAVREAIVLMNADQ